MNDEPRSSSDRVSAVIRAYLQAVESGTAPNQDEFIERHSDLADELRDFFANDAWLKACANEGTIGRGRGSDAATIPPSSQGSLSPVNRPGEIPEAFRQFGDYEVLEEIARGGMGVVYKARQISLNRIVALKMILSGQLSAEQDLQRFLAEAEAAANLDHPGIVPIFEVGEYNGQHYFSMGFVDGTSLAEKIQDGPLPAEIAVQFVKRVAEAMAFAHQHGVIHRDLKPGNVLVGRDGQPRVADFGLAKRVEHDSGLTTSGQILGTPSYMPPEQASGNPDQVGERSDVYAMGAILYALLTGRPPFQAANPLDTIMQVTMQDPVSPRQLNQQISRDLETICLKCLEKDPARRYPSAQALADELQCVMNGEPIKARPVGKIGRGLRWCRRNPSLAAALLATVVSLLAGSIVSTFFAYQSYQREQRARESERRAFHNLYAANLNLAQAAWNDANVHRVMELLEFFRPTSLDQEDLRGWEWYYMWRLCHADYQTLQGHTGVVFSLAYSSDGSMLATATDDTIRLWDVKSRRLLRTLHGHRDMVTFVTFHPDGKRIASGSTDGTARVWDVERGSQVASFTGHASVVRGIVFHENQFVADRHARRTCAFYDRRRTGLQRGRVERRSLACRRRRVGGDPHFRSGHTAIASPADRARGRRVASGLPTFHRSTGFGRQRSHGTGVGGGQRPRSARAAGAFPRRSRRDHRSGRTMDRVGQFRSDDQNLGFRDRPGIAHLEGPCIRRLQSGRQRRRHATGLGRSGRNGSLLGFAGDSRPAIAYGASQSHTLHRLAPPRCADGVGR
jgi:eukaryotic-like serine/threonine-protein kinase